MRILRSGILWGVLFAGAMLFGEGSANADELPIIDAHSQLPASYLTKKVVRLMDEAGVRMTVLSFRGSARGEHVLEIYKAHPDRIVPAIKTKGMPYAENSKKFYELISNQISNPNFAAMGEVILYHARKGNMAPKWVIPPDDERVAFLLDIARERGWPFTIHIEFAAARNDGAYETFMEKMEDLLRNNPDQPFLIIHMGQLDSDEAGRLLREYKNIHFITSHSNPLAVAKSSQPWVNLFDGEQLTDAWKSLMIAHSDRFLLGFDNVWEDHWGDYYLDQVKLWRKALADMPHDVAHQISHGNAERLWNLPAAGR